MAPTRRRLLASGATLLGTAAGCVGSPEAGSGPNTMGGDLEVTSTELESGETVPTRFTCDGEDVSPPLSVEGVPGEAKALAVVVDDPDAPGGTFTHWVLYNLPPDRTEIPAGVPTTAVVDSLGDARQGKNDFDVVGYRGPCPPAGSTHTYRFEIVALEANLDVEGGAPADRVEDAIEDHRIAFGVLTAPYG